MAEVGPQRKEVCQNSDDDEECDPNPPADEEPPPPRLKTLREVMDCHVQHTDVQLCWLPYPCSTQIGF